MVFRAARSDLRGVERGVACPLKQVLVHVPVISAEDRIQLLVIEIEGIHQRHGIGPELGQELLNVSGDLQGLWNTQQPGLQRTKGDENNQDRTSRPKLPHTLDVLPTAVKTLVL